MDRLDGFLRRFLELEKLFKLLEDRVSILEEHSVDHENRLSELEGDEFEDGYTRDKPQRKVDI